MTIDGFAPSRCLPCRARRAGTQGQPRPRPSSKSATRPPAPPHSRPSTGGRRGWPVLHHFPGSQRIDLNLLHGCRMRGSTLCGKVTWVPASAGMTPVGRASRPANVIPAEAGTHGTHRPDGREPHHVAFASSNEVARRRASIALRTRWCSWSAAGSRIFRCAKFRDDS